MTKHTNENLSFLWGGIYTVTGLSIARMDRGEPRTSPTERDANGKRLVQIWNAWPDVVAFLQDLSTWDASYRLSKQAQAQVEDMLARIRKEMPDG